MSLTVSNISLAEADSIRLVDEGQFSELKGSDVSPAKMTRAFSAFANADGGEIWIGITNKERRWNGFSNVEAASGHIQCFEEFFPLGNDFQYDFLSCDAYPGLVLHAQVNKTQGIMKASDGVAYVRRADSCLPMNTPEKYKRLEYEKGLASFETLPSNVPRELVVDSKVIADFIKSVVPQAEPEAWLRKNLLLRDGKPTVAALLLFAEEPQAALPKYCGIKVYRYKTSEAQGSRETLAFDPRTIEGCLYDQIKAAVNLTREVAESIPRLGDTSLEKIQYPPDAIHEIVTNAALHRDYSIADDVHIRIFDNRIEIQSPGRLPAHITPKNILDERFARNGTIVRILNKFPDPPNKDVGEGLNTAFAACTELGLKPPVIKEVGNSLMVIIRHEPLASPEETIMKYLEDHETIKNAKAREIAHVRADYQMKNIFKRMEDRGMIEQVEGTVTSQTAYRKVKKKGVASETISGPAASEVKS